MFGGLSIAKLLGVHVRVSGGGWLKGRGARSVDRTDAKKSIRHGHGDGGLKCTGCGVLGGQWQAMSAAGFVFAALAPPKLTHNVAALGLTNAEYP